jgi:hypothetical protein
MCQTGGPALLPNATKSFFDFTHEIHEAWLCNDLRMPTKIAFNQIVCFNDVGTRNGFASRILITSYPPEVICNSGRRGDVMCHHDDGV